MTIISVQFNAKTEKTVFVERYDLSHCGKDELSIRTVKAKDKEKVFRKTIFERDLLFREPKIRDNILKILSLKKTTSTVNGLFGDNNHCPQQQKTHYEIQGRARRKVVKFKSIFILFHLLMMKH